MLPYLMAFKSATYNRTILEITESCYFIFSNWFDGRSAPRNPKISAVSTKAY
ncbi:hypothetical protein C8J45_11812 [Sphingomonas sp. PP-CE-3G-477]|nr:hypothetical protein C8J45_11812 [Sphingomonas sp. PP-CE-3G-477]